MNSVETNAKNTELTQTNLATQMHQNKNDIKSIGILVQQEKKTMATMQKFQIEVQKTQSEQSTTMHHMESAQQEILAKLSTYIETNSPRKTSKSLHGSRVMENEYTNK